MQRTGARRRVLCGALALTLLLSLAVATQAREAAGGANPLRGHQQFINCETLSSSNQSWNPWLRARQARGNARKLLLKLAETPTVFSFAGTDESDISKRMERYMANVDHPSLGGPNCNTRLRYTNREWHDGPIPAGDSRRRYTGDYPVLAIRSLDYTSCKGGHPKKFNYGLYIRRFVRELGRTYVAGEYSYSDRHRPPASAFRSYRQRAATVILEPDYLALLGNGDGCVQRKAGRAGLHEIKYAVAKLSAMPNVQVYIDAGEDNWLSVNKAVRLLKQAGVLKGARGFVLNATHTGATKANIRYGNRIAKRLNRHYVINTAENAHGKLARKYYNGRKALPFGPPGVKGRKVPVRGGVNTNCNPPNAGLGTQPTTHTASTRADAYLYISRPGISSNSGNRCRRGPASNVWWQAQALNEARRASFKHAAWPPRKL